MKRLSTLILGVGVAALVSAGVVYADDRDHEHREHRTIQITRQGLQPDELKITSEDAVVWTNYTNELVRVVFAPEVAKSLICEGPSNFTIAEEALYSTPLRGNEFASVCRFEPGTYEYRVQILEAPVKGGATEELRGKLVVER